MNPDDIFERSLAALYEAALDDARWPAAAALVEEAVGTGGSTLSVGEGFDDDVRLYFARFLQRGHSREDVAREYFSVYHPHDEGLPRLRRRPHGQLVHVSDLYTEDELKTSPVAVTLGLTPSEGRMSALLAEGLKVREIAATTGWRQTYVRWLIQQVYRKLGVSGQVALVRQILAADALPRR